MAKGTLANAKPDAQARVRRGYFECRYGQLHVHNAIPPGGGFEEGTSLLCLHRNLMSGRVFQRFLILAGRDRSVYAPDTPGCGDSDPPSARPTILDYAGAIGDFLDSMRFRQIDILGHQAGALIAAELAIARPKQIRRVVLVSVPVVTDADKDLFRRAPSPSFWPASAAPDGGPLATEWLRLREAYGPQVPVEVVGAAFAEQLRNAPQAAWSHSAALQYPARERLGLITQPTLVLRPKDDLWESTQRARGLLPRARFVDLPEQGLGLFETAADVATECVKEFLRS